jgi:hypothetical protein
MFITPFINSKSSNFITRSKRHLIELTRFNWTAKAQGANRELMGRKQFLEHHRLTSQG